MLVAERIGTDSIKVYSDEGKYIIQEGTGDKYPEAIDPLNSGRMYRESDELIEQPEEETEGEGEDMNEEDKSEAREELGL